MKCLSVITVLTALAASPSLTHADVLYDALYRDISGPESPYVIDRDINAWLTSFIGGGNLLDKPYDTQVCDDFRLEEPATITAITFDKESYLSLLPPEYMVEIFADSGGTPSETPTVTVTTSNITAVEFPGSGGWANDPRDPAHRVTLNLGEDAVALDPGVWWISIIALTNDDLWPARIFQFEHATLSEPHYRDAAMDHGNDGFLGLDSYFDWVPATAVGPYVPHHGDIAMRIEGTTGSPCPADFTADGALNFFDVSAFLSLFAAQDPRADMTKDGTYNFFDVSAFLADFSQGCP